MNTISLLPNLEIVLSGKDICPPSKFSFEGDLVLLSNPSFLYVMQSAEDRHFIQSELRV